MCISYETEQYKGLKSTPSLFFMSSSKPHMANPVFSSSGKLDFHLTCDIIKFPVIKVIRLTLLSTVIGATK